MLLNLVRRFRFILIIEDSTKVLLKYSNTLVTVCFLASSFSPQTPQLVHHHVVLVHHHIVLAIHPLVVGKYTWLIIGHGWVGVGVDRGD